MSRCQVSLIRPAENGLSQEYRRIIRRYFHGIGIPHHFCSVSIVYQISAAINEESINILKRKMPHKAALIRQDTNCSKAAAQEGQG